MVRRNKREVGLFLYCFVLFSFICWLGEGESKRSGHRGEKEIEFRLKTNGFAAVMSYMDGDTGLVPLSFGRKLKPNFGLGSQEQIPDWYINGKE